MILVTSAYGSAGKNIITELVTAGMDVRAIDINPDVASLKETHGVKETQVGDLTNRRVIEKAVTGVDTIVFIPPMFVAEEAYIGKAFVDEAIKQHVKKFVFISVTHSIMSTLTQHIAKRDIEEYLIYKQLTDNINFTILQPMHYMYNFNPNTVREQNKYSIFYDIETKLSYVDARDVGEIVVKVIKEDIHNGATYELSCTDFLSPVDMINLYNQTFDETAIAEYLPVDTLMEFAHIDNVYAVDTFRKLAKTYSEYGIRGNANTLTILLGRKPITFTEYLQREMKKD